MAEDTNYISGGNEINKLDEDKSKDDSGKKPLAAKKRVVAVPHYLRASTGSCHDACKYGKPHVFKEKPWRAVRRTSAPPPMTEKTLEIQIFVDNKLKKKSVGVDKLDDSPSSEVKKSFQSFRKSAKSEKTVMSQISVDNKLKKSVGVLDKLDDSASSVASATDTTVKKIFLSSRKSPKSVDNKLKKSVGVDKLEDDSPSSVAPATDTTVKKSFLLSRKSLRSGKTVMSQISVDNKLKKSVGLDKVDDSPSSEAPATNITVKKSFLSSRKSLKSEKTAVSQISVDKVDKLEESPSSEAPATNTTVKKSFLSSRKPPLHESSKLVKQEAGLLIDSSSKALKVMKKAVLFPGRSSLTASSNFSKREDLSNSIEDLVSVSTPSTPKVRSVSAGTARLNRLAVRSSKRQPGTDIKFTDSPRKVLTPPATTLSVKSNNVRKTVSIGQKDRIMMNKAEVKKPNNEMVKEKTLHMIETSEVSNHFIQSPSPLSPESLNSSSQGNSLSFTSNEVELDSGSTDSDGDDSISNYNNRSSVNSKAVDQDSTALKLKFRRGKVIELESGTRGPRKLRFKQGTILGDDHVSSSGSRRKSFKKRVVDSDKKEVGTDQVKIALKHQETVTKDEHGLYNNVIEEAASKLVEKRKNKVMALVGAFETVISLQERNKPSTANKYE
ncbi:uncharacterized protein LOC141618748 [Silene latifolia]|uniref:uncharacterized protein LOC141618748 n=1 Tax=Silene latifolia TaxID=37657 RepID=UPI003D78179B